MRKTLLAGALLIVTAGARPAEAQSNFDVLYFGGGVASLAPGSDNPIGTNILPGSSFLWNILAQGGAYWDVVTGGNFFPLMAFASQPSGLREGNFTLNLYRNGSSVFTLSETGSRQRCVHIGTNTVSLTTGLTFDRMELDYLLTRAEEEASICNGVDGVPINSELGGLLPIFGGPELNQFSPGIEYVSNVVPEPATLAMTVFGLGFLGLTARRRNRQG